MEKYSRLSKITNDFLHGKLAKLQVNYENEYTMTLNFFYEDSHHYLFDYEMQVNIANHEVDYASHHSKGYMNKVELERECAFEKAVFNELFTNHLQLN